MKRTLLMLAAAGMTAAAAEIRFTDETVPSAVMATLTKTAKRHVTKIPAQERLTLTIDKKLPEEGFSISGTGDILLSGGSARALFYALGKHLRDGAWRGTDRPEKPERGVYFATHFGNWYDHADEQELADYIADLALWGCNEIAVWFDMHTYTGAGTPEAREKISKLREILAAAGNCGLHRNLLGLANEAFSGSPKELRADWRGGRNGYKYDLNGHYHVEICPSRPGGTELILKWRGEVLDAFAGCGIDRITIFPYDQGGCTCSSCAPYGANGYLKIAKRYSELARKKFPGCAVQLSTWRFNSFVDGEWEKLFERGGELKTFADVLYVDPADRGRLASGTPGGLPFTLMSEISMGGMLPWGGFGANPQPVKLEKELATSGGAIGFRPYSEGIYEDMNKVLLLSWCWKPRPMREIAEDYAAFYFGERNRAKIAKAAFLIEENMNHRLVIEQDGTKRSAYSAELVDAKKPWAMSCTAIAATPERSKKIMELVEEADQDDGSWRWRIFKLRAEIDCCIASGNPADEKFAELCSIYKADGKTIPCLIPPAQSVWKSALSGKVDTAQGDGQSAH